MNTECKPEQLEFQSLGRREVIGRFDGGRITSDGGGLLLREVDQRIGLLDRLAACFTDHRNPESGVCQQNSNFISPENIRWNNVAYSKL